MKGVYILANDGMEEMLIAFLNSFRRFNPTLPLCLIPFNEDTHWLISIAPRYKFTIFDNKAVLRACDEISVKFHGHVVGQYRKIACWHGVFERFIYVDVDTVILLSFESIWNVSAADVVTSQSNLSGTYKWVWRKSMVGAHALLPEQERFAANTGFIVSSYAVLSLAHILRILPDALLVKDHMQLSTYEQAPLNYFIVTSGCSYTSLRRLEQEGHAGVPQERWGGYPEPHSENGIIVGEDSVSTLMIHWAGEWRKGKHRQSSIWRYYRDLETT